MNVMKSFFVLLSLSVALVGCAVPGGETEPASESAAVTTPAPVTSWSTVDRIEEDEPGWDCATMGNKVCGGNVTAEPVEREPYEDEPGWDCATMGNKVCGVTPVGSQG